MGAYWFANFGLGRAERLFNERDVPSLGRVSIALQRRFALVLEGSTRASTRRYIQAAFNRPTSSPRVLIAQSVIEASVRARPKELAGEEVADG